jgi:hypothetical protein
MIGISHYRDAANIVLIDRGAKKIYEFTPDNARNLAARAGSPS